MYTRASTNIFIERAHIETSSIFLKKRQKKINQHECITKWLHKHYLIIANCIVVNLFIFFDFKIVQSTSYLLKQWLLERQQGVLFFFCPLMPPSVNKYGHIVAQIAIFPYILLNTCLWYTFFLYDNIKRLYCYVWEMSILLIFAKYPVHRYSEQLNQYF